MNNKTYFKVLTHYWKNQRSDALIAPFYYLFENFSPTIETIAFAAFFDAVYNSLNGITAYHSKLIMCGVILILLYLIKQVMQLIASISTNAGIFERSMYLLGTKIADKSASLPLVMYENSKIMDMKKRAEECVENDRIPSIFMLSVVLATAVAGIGSLLITLFMYNWILAIIAVISVSQFYIAASIQENRQYELSSSLTRAKRHRDYIWSLFLDLKSIKEMRIMNACDFLAEKWKSYRNEINDKMWKEELREHKGNTICNLIKLSGYLMGIITALILVSNGHISVGVFGATITAFVTVQNTIQNHISSIGKIPNFLKYAKDFFDYTELPIDTKHQSIKNENISRIALENVSFKYPNADSNAIKNISLNINKGETIAIVGENGSGKTTLIKTLLGVYAPSEGCVKVNGNDISEIEKESLYNDVSFISQDHMVYDISLKENIALADIETIQDGKVKTLLKEVDLTELASDIDVSFGKEFGGIELSGGQKQKLAIARALYKNGQFLILDEPTSALDPLQESEILERFINMSKDKTSIVITHRIGICTKVDRIIVMKEGKVVEDGNHDELIKRNGEYAKLFNAQSKWYVNQHN